MSAPPACYLAPVRLSVVIPTLDEAERVTASVSSAVGGADEVLVVNVGGYVGESTRREIEHARSRGIAVSFLEPHADDHHAAG